MDNFVRNEPVYSESDETDKEVAREPAAKDQPAAKDWLLYENSIEK